MRLELEVKLDLHEGLEREQFECEMRWMENEITENGTEWKATFKF